MQHTTFVRRREPCANLTGELDGLVLRQPPDTAQQRGKILAVDILHREEVQTLDHTEIVDAADIGMRHLARDANFIAEPHQRRLADMRRRQKLQRDGLVEDQVEGFINLAHTAVSEQPENPVPPGEHGACWKSPFFRSARRWRRAIKQRIWAKEHRKVMIVRTDDGVVDGIFETDGYVDARQFDARELAEMIAGRVQELRTKQD